MTSDDFIRQLDEAQSKFENAVSFLAMSAAKQDDRYLPGIARCVATLNALKSARQFDWEKYALESGEWKPPETEITP